MKTKILPAGSPIPTQPSTIKIDWVAVQDHVAHTLAQAKEELRRTPGYGHFIRLPITLETFNPRSVRLDLLIQGQGMFFVDILLTNNGYGDIVGIPTNPLNQGLSSPFDLTRITQNWLPIANGNFFARQKKWICLTKESAKEWLTQNLHGWLAGLDCALSSADEKYDIVHWGFSEFGQHILQEDADAATVPIPEGSVIAVWDGNSQQVWLPERSGGWYQDVSLQNQRVQEDDRKDVIARLHKELSPWLTAQSTAKPIVGQINSPTGVGWIMAAKDGQTIVPFSGFDAPTIVSQTIH